MSGKRNKLLVWLTVAFVLTMWAITAATAWPVQTLKLLEYLP